MTVNKIVELINSNGRQGPRNILSQEVYNWIKKDIKISYKTYTELIKSNSIDDSQRDSIRSVYFVQKNNTYGFLKSNEAEIRPYLAKIIYNNPDLTSHEILKIFKSTYTKYTIVDRMIQRNLTGEQEIIDQTVRNILVSNYTKTKNYEMLKRSENSPYKYRLRDNYIFNNKSSETEVAKEEKTFNAYEHIKIQKATEYYPTNDDLKDKCYKHANYKCEIDSKHITFPTPNKENYLEGHHIVPMKYQNTFPNINLDQLDNLIALCPTCHRKIHLGNEQVKKEIILGIFNKREEKLLKMGFSKENLRFIIKDMLC